MVHGTILPATATVKRQANAMMRTFANAQTGRLPYFCECSDSDCLRAVWLSPAEYDGRRKGSAAPLLSDHHEPPLARVS